MSAEQIAIWAGAGTALAGLAAVAWQLVRVAVRVAGRVDEVVEDWRGQPARPGVAARAGIMSRLAGIEATGAATAEETRALAARLTRVEHELHPNGGASLRDAIDRVEARTAQIPDDQQQ